MADNVRASAGTNDGATFATDDDGTAHHPYVKLEFGADNTQTKVSSSDPLPVVQTGTHNIGTVTAVTSITNAVAVTNGGLTELAAAINASSQMDVNIAASAATVAVSNAGITTIAGAVSGTEMQVDVVGALPAGTNAIGKLAANSGVDIGDVDVTSISAGTNSIGGVFVRPETTGGLSTARSLDLDETEEEIKATAGQVYGWNITNFRTTTVYVKFYNDTAANVAVGTTTPHFTLAIPGNSSDDTMLAQALSSGIAFSTAITWAATTGLADNDTGAPAANDVAGTVWYK